MSIKLGIHIGPQDVSMEDMKRLWTMADEAKMYWASLMDHFYANPLRSKTDPCFEAVSSMAALAATTSHVRVGTLMFCSLYRNPGLLAKAAITMDHISNGRVELGIGAGWFKEEFEDYGYEFPEVKERMDQFEEALIITKTLLREGEVKFDGKYYKVDAVSRPMPVNRELRIWVGGRGPKRTPRIAAQYADGFNTPYCEPDEFADRMGVLDAACEKFGRDPKAIMRTINVHFLIGADEAGIKRGQDFYDNLGDQHRRGAMLGGKQQAIDRIGEYIKAGADGLNIAFRPPVDWDAYQMYLEEIVPVFHGK